jgi:adenosine deaminase
MPDLFGIMMTTSTLKPFAEIPIDPLIAALPKADIHIHPEWAQRLDRVLAKRDGREAYNWRVWAENLMQTEPPGEARLHQISSHFPVAREDDAIPENFVARVVDLLEEAAADGAVFVEVRFGKDMAERPNCIPLFHEAVRQVQLKYPQFQAAAIPYFDVTWEATKLERALQNYMTWAKQGLIFGADLMNQPYGVEADWTNAYRIAERLVAAGLDITVHVAEVSPANLASALKVPGLTRVGHATHAGYHPELLEMLAKSGVTVECSLTCNVVFGAADSYEAHPIRRFVEAGIPVAICTDNPVQMCTTIGREYAIAHALGFSPQQLLGLTRNAIQVAFIAPEQCQILLAKLDAFQNDGDK